MLHVPVLRSQVTLSRPIDPEDGDNQYPNWRAVNQALAPAPPSPRASVPTAGAPGQPVCLACTSAQLGVLALPHPSTPTSLP